MTPMWRQYHAIKKEHPDILVLFRLGDFYEMFGADAELAARELELTLTHRDFGKDQRLPMCGVPHHAVERYLARLIAKGYKAAICEQMEDPQTAKGLVKREVTRVVTPGTVVEESMLEAGSNNFLLALAEDAGVWGIAVVDVSTGEFLVTELHGEEARAKALEEVGRLQPAEVLLPPSLAAEETLRQALALHGQPTLTKFTYDRLSLGPPDHFLCQFFRVASLRGFGCEQMPCAVEAAAHVLAYLQETQKSALEHLTALGTYSTSDFMTLDAATRRNLELTQSIRDGSRSGTLLWLLDQTLTPMGKRLLKNWLLQPLTDVARIQQRLDAVEELHRDALLRQEVRARLRQVYDIERLVAKSASARANGRDLIALRHSLYLLPQLRELLHDADSVLLRRCAEQLGDPHATAELIEVALREDPPTSLQEGGLIKEGYSAELDELRRASREGKDWIANLEQTERQRTGIKSLKVGYNQVFGYYIEVTRPNLPLVPDNYIRKQTTANGERFITPELKEYEALVLGAEEKIVDLEYRLFCEVRNAVAAEAEGLMRSARAVAQLDVLANFAEVAARNAYVKPEVDGSDRLEIRAGRHPVVEVAQREERFVPNDVRLDCQENQLLIITGPNFSGKSTYLRQTALIVLMAQIGCFVPAEAARIGVVDRIFTRVGAYDDLSSGQSTFMVEMNETANILHNATRRSLILLDEVGRGTSTFDGLSIAWAVAEYIHNEQRIGAKTLFATHYHHLNELESQLPRVRNFRVEVAEEGDTITFLRRIVPGGTDRSYGIEVARLAGLPQEVLDRAREVLKQLESENGRPSVGPARDRVPAPPRPAIQLTLFQAEADPVIEELKKLDLTNLTPLQALNKLWELQGKVR